MICTLHKIVFISKEHPSTLNAVAPVSLMDGLDDQDTELVILFVNCQMHYSKRTQCMLHVLFYSSSSQTHLLTLPTIVISLFTRNQLVLTYSLLSLKRWHFFLLSLFQICWCFEENLHTVQWKKHILTDFNLISIADVLKQYVYRLDIYRD